MSDPVISAINTLKSEADRIGKTPIKALMEDHILSGLAHFQGLGFQVDLSKQRLDDKVWMALLALAEARNLKGARDALFSGAHVNASEDRPALHWALRGDAGQIDRDMAEHVTAGLSASDVYAEKIRSGEITASNGKPFRSIVHIGIGGSDFGPRLLMDALQAEADKRFELRFAANIDPFDLDAALEGLDPHETLVIGVSKSFSTQETLYNLDRARHWISEAIGENNTAQHFALVTAATAKADAWAGKGVAQFHLPDQVGGRYSIWSAASLACAIALGKDAINDFRAGAAEMDAHTANASVTDSLPARLAMLDVWNASFLGEAMRVLVTYSRRLRMLPTYLQQLELESNGKSVTPEGKPALLSTIAALWGGEGTIGQHSYHQWLHQGQGAPVEFLLALDKSRDIEGNRALAAHALAQSRALLEGRSEDEIDEADDAIRAQRVVQGDRPSSFIFAPDTSPRTLGKLIALYEHRTYLAGALWGINPFDQWGVELGKVMAKGLEDGLNQHTAPAGLDASTLHLFETVSKAL